MNVMYDLHGSCARNTNTSPPLKGNFKLAIPVFTWYEAAYKEVGGGGEGAWGDSADISTV